MIHASDVPPGVAAEITNLVMDPRAHVKPSLDQILETELVALWHSLNTCKRGFDHVSKHLGRQIAGAKSAKIPVDLIHRPPNRHCVDIG